MAFVPRARILDIEPYVPGASKGGTGRVIKLSSNENPYGPSPMAMEAYRNATEFLHRYPDGGSVELRAAIAKKHNIDPARIVCGTGSDELIALLCRSYCGEGDEVLYTRHGFLMYPIAALAAGATPVQADEPQRRTDLDCLLSSITDKTKIIFIANPNNPTGALVKASDLRAFHAQLRADIMLVIDSAYAEYVEEEDYTDGLDMVTEFDNVVMLRTFSKIYGLGGMRIGWSYSSIAIADVLNRVRGIFNINIAAQAAGIAALKDDNYVSKSLRNNSEQKKIFSDRLINMGLVVYPSEGNFVLFSLGTADRAADCLNRLKADGILLRGMDAYGLPDCIRATIGLPEDMDEVARAIGAIISPDAA